MFGGRDRLSRRTAIRLWATGALVAPILAACGGPVATTTGTATAQGTASGTSATQAKVSGASTGEASSGSAGATKRGNGQIAFWHWGDQSYYTRYRALADAFQRTHPQVTIDAVLKSKDFTSAILAAIAGGSPPESFTLDGQNGQSFGQKQALMVLDSRVHASKLLKMDQYDDLTKRVLAYKGKMIGLAGVSIPSGEAPNLFFYNADHFRQAGVATPYDQWKADTWTWDAFAESAQRLVKRDASGKMTLVPVGDDSLTRLWVNSAGGKEVDDVIAPTKSFYDAPPAIKALQFIFDLRHKYGVVPVEGVDKELKANDDNAFIQGRLSMHTRWTTGINLYRQINDFKWGMVPYPKDVTYANDASIAGLAIPKGAAHLDAAWSWVEWASSPAGQKVDAATTTGVPYDPEAKQVFLDELKKIPNLETPDVPGALVPNGRDTFFRLFCINMTELNAIIGKQVGQMLAGQASAATTGGNIKQLMDAYLKANPQG